MKELYKNPITYFIVVPVIILLWPLVVRFAYIPKVEDNLIQAQRDWKDAEKYVDGILQVDRGRLAYADPNKGKVKFDYVTVIDSVAKECGISYQNYTFSNKPPRRSRGRKTQSARVMLQNVDIEKFAKFISTLQLRWTSLQCEGLTLTKVKGAKDSWKADLDFVYYF